MRFRRTGGELQHVGSFLSQAPAVQDLTVTLLKFIKLQRVGRIQQSVEKEVIQSHRFSPHATTGVTSRWITASPLVHVVLLTLSFPRVCVTLVPVAIVVRGGFTPGVGVLRVSAYK